MEQDILKIETLLSNVNYIYRGASHFSAVKGLQPDIKIQTGGLKSEFLQEKNGSRVREGHLSGFVAGTKSVQRKSVLAVAFFGGRGLANTPATRDARLQRRRPHVCQSNIKSFRNRAIQIRSIKSRCLSEGLHNPDRLP